MKAIIFDMDGTLIDSKKAIEATINEMRKSIGLEPNLDSDFIVEIINNPEKNYIKEFYGLDSITIEQKINFEKSFRKNYDLYAKAYDGIKEMLEKCREKGYLITLASNAPKDSLQAILKKTGIIEYFDLIEGASKDTPQKPDPTMLNLVMKELKNEYGNNVKGCFVGDSIKDEEAAINAKMPYIQVTWGFGRDSNKYQNVSEVDKLVDEISAIF
ncbi:phosphoglycolate phosphatase-like HAD superfamily hydrolase [Campylobacter blaseri]|uniref:phosphoglycolate phosphatase n=1 Tax=Campylobacter blaseri TaxID=2042961 RepID=A0A2P8QZJ6_9BACT|nr:HAD family hydrolase [Campylobacter blaseri]PSM51673.1 haloacid dehalogenase [Campylobacter blaseri]PSM53463.1 haloacid dehalogenase [Campylobacter blaseri]QKF86268.1 phosphoglycolate phosphatase-like HAD superfamily hydrolase [Campylobacter blaseri]